MSEAEAETDRLRWLLTQTVRSHRERAFTDDEALNSLAHAAISAVGGLLMHRGKPLPCECVDDVMRSSLPPNYRAAVVAELRDATDDECRLARAGTTGGYDVQRFYPDSLVSAAMALRRYYQTKNPDGG